MLPIDEPFEGLDEVWIWPIPHPGDPEQPKKAHRITRIGTRDEATFAGRVQLRTRPSRLMLGPPTDLEGLGPWRRAELGSAGISQNAQFQISHGWVHSGGVEALWKPRGHFQIGDREERNQIATGGYPYPPTVKELGESALELGKGLLRRVRGRDAEVDPAPSDDPAEATGPVEVSAFDGWLTATPVEEGEHLAWRITIDRHPSAPESVGLGVVLAAISLLHRS